MPTKSHAATYLEGLSVGSHAAMRSALDTIARKLGGKGANEFAWERLSYADLQGVRAWLNEKYAPKTINRMLSAVRGVATACWMAGAMSADEYQRIMKVKSVRLDGRRTGRAVSNDEIGRLLAAATALEAGLLAAMYAGGLRRAETCSLNAEDYDQRAGSLRVTGKRNKIRLAYLHKDWCRLISTACNSAGPLFTLHGDRIQPRKINIIVQKLCKRAKVDAFTPHDLRRSFATNLLTAGEDIFTIKDMMGHENIATTSLYDHRSDARKQKAAERLGGPPK